MQGGKGVSKWTREDVTQKHDKNKNISRMNGSLKKQKMHLKIMIFTRSNELNHT